MKKVVPVAFLLLLLVCLTTCSILGDVISGIPIVPLNFRVYAESESEMRLHWRLSQNATEYVIYRATSANGPYKEHAVIKDSHRKYYYDRTDVRRDTTYYYKIMARNSHGSSPQSAYIQCKTPNSVNRPSNPNGTDYSFWAVNLSIPGTLDEDPYYRTWAKKVWEGVHCIVYQEIQGYTAKSPAHNSNVAEAIAWEFDTKIHPNVTNVFGHPWNDDDDELHHGKVVLLLLNIQDGYRGGGDPYVAGFFHSTDLFEGMHSNARNMLYIDTWPMSLPTKKDVSASIYDTIAHEFQHLINASKHWANHQRAMELWIDEGLAESATFVYNEKSYQESRIEYYRRDPRGSIRRGNTFFVWNDRHNDILAEYSTVYIFFQWLRIQAGTMDIYKEIINSTYSDFHSVVDAVKNYPEFLMAVTDLSLEASLLLSSEVLWEKILMRWFTANLLCEPTGIHGYKGVAQFNNLNAKAISGSLNLAPGEGVYSVLGSQINSRPPNSGVNIQYAGIDKENGELTQNWPLAQGSYLLTFNRNPVIGGNKTSTLEFGYVANFPGARSFLGLDNDLSGYRVPEPWEWDPAAYFRRLMNGDN